MNRIEILSWSDRFFCPDLLEIDFIALLQQSIDRKISTKHFQIVACVEENVAALISVAFDYPNTFIAMNFSHRFQMAFVEDVELLKSKNFLEKISSRALYRTILSFRLDSNSNEKFSMKTHALFQTLLTPIDVQVLKSLNVNYFDVFISDNCLVEIFRLLIVKLFFDEEKFSKSKLNRTNSIDFLFISYLTCRKYSKLKTYLKRLGLTRIKKSDLILLEYICHIVIRRSTQMLSCLIVGLADRYNEENLTVAIESFLYRLCPIYSSYLNDEIELLCKSWIRNFHFVLPTDKSYVN